MRYKIRKTEDADEAREMHQLSFPRDDWVGDDHEYWFATDEKERVVGFASAIHHSDCGGVYLSRCGVLPEGLGQGLQMRFIRSRILWARRSGAKFVYTYTTIKNYSSLCNLLKCGFRFVRPPGDWRRYHCFVLPLYTHVDLKAAAIKVAELVK